ncbi:glycosyltransferase [Cryptosporangium arvum]|nr:glycosyltransferase [Cryptosporangium arvum]
MGSARRPILFVSYPEAGLINPLFVLAEELSRRGVDDLWFATDDIRADDVAALKVETPVEFASLGDVVPELSAQTWDDETYRKVTQGSRFGAHRAVVEKTFVPRLRVEKYRRLEEIVRRVRPALIVVESLCQFGREVAITHGIPFVVSTPFLPSTLLAPHIPFVKGHASRGFPVPHSGLPFVMTPKQRAVNLLFKFRNAAMGVSPAIRARVAEDAAVRKELGIADGTSDIIARAEMVLCYSIPELDYPLRIPEKMKMVGTVVPPLPQTSGDDDLSAWLDAHPSIVYLAFGTITRFTPDEVHAMVEVAHRLDGRHHLLWRLPPEQREWLPEELPPNLRVESWLPSQLDVLAHPNVRLFFTHAGSNGFHEGVYFGKPQVARPLWVDCYDEAIRGQDLGISLTLDHPDRVDPDDVVDKLTRVLDDLGFRDRAQRLGARLHAAGGRATAADLLQALPQLSTR